MYKYNHYVIKYFHHYKDYSILFEYLNNFKTFNMKLNSKNLNIINIIIKQLFIKEIKFNKSLYLKNKQTL